MTKVLDIHLWKYQKKTYSQDCAVTQQVKGLTTKPEN